jgi:sortase A
VAGSALLAACSQEAVRATAQQRDASGEASAAPALPGPSGAAATEPRVTLLARPEPAPEPRRSFLSVPAIGLADFPLVRYRGSPDDAPGTAIQDSGPLASPRGPGGGVGPGVVGNFIVTGHRTSHTMPFAELPTVRAGARVVVRSGGTEHVYEVTRTRWTSFRSPTSLAAQAAPVPGRPHQDATRPMITLSTCATPEDHANGNYWSDELGNPEHRIDKIGVLVAQRPA